MLLHRSWKWQSTLNCEMQTSPDTLWMLLDGFASTAWNMALESLVLGLPNFARSSRFLQPKWGFLKHLASVPWSTAQRMFLFTSATLWPSSNLYSIRSWIRLHCTFIRVAFKLHTDWSNAQRVSTLTTTILPKHKFLN